MAFSKEYEKNKKAKATKYSFPAIEDGKVYCLIRLSYKFDTGLADVRVVSIYTDKVKCEQLRDILNEEMRLFCCELARDSDLFCSISRDNNTISYACITRSLKE